jgi:DNA-binding transcriptional regulator YiaG
MKGVSESLGMQGDYLRRARVDRKLTNVQVAHLLGAAYQTVEKWEHNRAAIGASSRPKVIAFIGYDPEAPLAEPNT